MKIERIIFLDFDGVIITPATNFRRFDKPKMQMLQKIIDETGAFIVISSSWKIGSTFRSLRAMFDGWGMFDKVIGVTPNLNGNFIRGQEIDAWLKEPKLASNEFELDLKSFIILDDDEDMEPHMDRLVQTPWDEGLTGDSVKKAIKMLTNP